MIRLLKIELGKLRGYRSFWFLTAVYILMLAGLVFGIPEFIDYLISKTGENTKLRIFKAVVFNFPDIWQNIGFIASSRFFIKNLLALIVILVITNEYMYQTVRLNVTAGLSRDEFILSKIGMVILFSLLSTVILFFSGLYLGLMNSASRGIGDIFGKMEFLLAYFLEIFTYMIFALFIGFLVKRQAMSAIVLLAYLIVEPIIEFKLPDALDPYLPLNAMNALIRTPNTSLIKVKTPGMSIEIQQSLAFSDIALCLGYAALFTGLMYFIQRKRDL